MDINEVGRVLNITKRTIYNHIDRGNLNPVKRGGEWYFDGAEVYRFMHKRNISKERHNPTNAPPVVIADRREFPARHILDLVDMLRRFELRYEGQQRYMPLFELEKMLTSVFIQYEDSQQFITGRELNEVLDYMDSRKETGLFEERGMWGIFYEGIKYAFTEPNSQFDRRPILEDILIDAVIELTSKNPSNL